MALHAVIRHGSRTLTGAEIAAGLPPIPDIASFCLLSVGRFQETHRSMVDHALLHTRLSALVAAELETADFGAALQALTAALAESLGIDGAGATVWMPNTETTYITATDDTALRVERSQDELGEGACMDAIRSSTVVAVGDLVSDTRWPKFGPVALQTGFSAVAAVPIRHSRQGIGAIDLYAAKSRTWSEEECAAAQLVADVAAGYLVNRRLLDQAEQTAAQLQHALDSRIVVEQAKGILAERYRLAPDEAFDILRAYTRSARRKLQDVANGVIDGTIDPRSA